MRGFQEGLYLLLCGGVDYEAISTSCSLSAHTGTSARYLFTGGSFCSFLDHILSSRHTLPPGPGGLSTLSPSRQHDQLQITHPSPLQRSKYTRPSIPQPGQAFGYTQDEGGRLRKQDRPFDANTGQVGDQIGPNHYSLREGATRRRITGGCFTGAVRKGMSNLQDVPGPGHYMPNRKVGNKLLCVAYIVVGVVCLRLIFVCYIKHGYVVWGKKIVRSLLWGTTFVHAHRIHVRTCHRS